MYHTLWTLILKSTKKGKLIIILNSDEKWDASGIILSNNKELVRNNCEVVIKNNYFKKSTLVSNQNIWKFDFNV